MAFDGICVAALKKELNDTCLSLQGTAFISKVAQPEKDELILSLKTRSGNKKLMISANASLPLIYFTENSKTSPMTAPAFCMLLRKHLSSGRICNVKQPSLERILIFEIEHLNELGDPCKKNLIVELMGKHSNIIFTDSDETIIDSVKHISQLLSSVREVLPGRHYFIPNTMDKIDPYAEISFDYFHENVIRRPLPAAKALYSSFTGFSPLISQEICYRAGIDGDASASSLSDIECQSLYNQFLYLLRDIKNGSFSPVIYYDKNDPDHPLEFSVFPLSMYEGNPYETFDTVSSMLEKYYQEKEKYSRMRQKTADLRKIITTALERNIKKADIQKKQLKDTDKMDKYRIYGELINTYGYNVASGSKSFKAVNYYNNEEIEIPLDPAITVSENGKKYFERYQKLKRTKDAVTLQLLQTEAEIQHLDSVLTNLDLALTDDDLMQLRLELEITGIVKKSAQGRQKRTVSKPMHYKTSDGFDIYVGKNNLQNDELTFKLANGNDWWFHAKKMPGSHVIVKMTGQDELPDSVFEKAAALAAYYSKGKDSEKVEIDYLQRKNVKKPAGAKPGFVVYYTNFSMSIAPDISGLTLIK